MYKICQDCDMHNRDTINSQLEFIVDFLQNKTNNVTCFQNN